ncbi:MAG: aminotransferase class III-fold pyridoxal phosphate-dependent enzyme [Vicinamibacterales bacterium]
MPAASPEPAHSLAAAQAEVDRGDALAKLGRWRDALIAFEAAAELAPEWFWAHYFVGDALANLHEWNGVLLAMRRAAAIDPGSYWARYQLGHALCRLDRWDEGAVELQHAIAVDGTQFWGHFWLGRALLQLERWGEAVDALDRAVALDASVGWTYGHLAVALVHAGDAARAADAAALALELEPRWLLAHHARGLALAGLGRTDAAVDAFNDALDIDYRHSASYVAMGDALRIAHRVPEAADAYRRAADFASAAECLDLADTLCACRRADDAIAVCLRAVLVDIRCTAAYKKLTALLLEAGRHQDVAALLEEAVALGAADDEMRLMLRRAGGEEDSRASQMASPAGLYDGLIVSHAENDVLHGPDDRRYVDLFSGCGTVFLGHSHPEVTAAVHRQVDRIWNTGTVPTSVRLEAARAVEAYFPLTHQVAAFYSTGMEAVEFALRLVRGATGRERIIGFERCMHGKSAAAAALGWANGQLAPPEITRLPYVPQRSESDILAMLADELSQRPTAAVFIEPLQGSGGGHLASTAFFVELSDLCARHGALFVVDEIFTGFHRTGTPFLYTQLGVEPDVVLAGKAMGNGFPVSAVVSRRAYSIGPGMLPGSTYAGNPLAMAAVSATLAAMQRLPLTSMVQRIEEVVRGELRALVDAGIPLRGRGALWVMEFPDHRSAADVAMHARREGVIVSLTGAYIRLLPPATISIDRLTDACRIVRAACLAASLERR